MTEHKHKISKLALVQWDALTHKTR